VRDHHDIHRRENALQNLIDLALEKEVVERRLRLILRLATAAASAIAVAALDGGNVEQD